LRRIEPKRVTRRRNIDACSSSRTWMHWAITWVWIHWPSVSTWILGTSLTRLLYYARACHPRQCQSSRLLCDTKQPIFGPRDGGLAPGMSESKLWFKSLIMNRKHNTAKYEERTEDYSWCQLYKHDAPFVCWTCLDTSEWSCFSTHNFVGRNETRNGYCMSRCTWRDMTTLKFWGLSNLLVRSPCFTLDSTVLTFHNEPGFHCIRPSLLQRSFYSNRWIVS
jgi:hypothetical protein